MRRLTRPAHVPQTLLNLKATADAAVAAQYAAGITSLQFRQHVYGAADVRQALDSFHDGKCAYCEAALRPVTAGHIEHFRPKGAYVDETTGTLESPGYFWLAYEWINLLLSCPRCNSAANKGNRFPLTDENTRATPVAPATVNEVPLLVDPTSDSPRRHIRFRDEVAYPVLHSTKGAITREILDLNDPVLKEARAEHLEVVALLRSVRDGVGDHHEQVRAEKLLQRYESGAGKFLSCLKDKFHLNTPA